MICFSENAMSYNLFTQSHECDASDEREFVNLEHQMLCLIHMGVWKFMSRKLASNSSGLVYIAKLGNKRLVTRCCNKKYKEGVTYA